MTTTVENTALIIFVTFCVLVLRVHGQNDECVPQAVKNITISANATLWWEVDPDEPCEITAFEVDVTGDSEDKFHFSVVEDFVDLSFLKVCELWKFMVIPVSHSTLGYSRTLTAHVPLPPDADLSLGSLYMNLTGEYRIFWGLTDQTLANCTLKYRLTIEDQDRGTEEDVYLEGHSTSLSLSPCISYQLTVRAINVAHPIIEGPLRRTHCHIGWRVQTPPTLKSVVAQYTSLNITWALEGDTNRCPLKNFHVDGGDYFNFTLPLQNPPDPYSVVTEIDSLKPNSMYHFSVSVENNGGWSPRTHVAVQTLPLVVDD